MVSNCSSIVPTYFPPLRYLEDHSDFINYKESPGSLQLVYVSLWSSLFWRSPPILPLFFTQSLHSPVVSVQRAFICQSEFVGALISRGWNIMGDQTVIDLKRFNKVWINNLGDNVSIHGRTAVSRYRCKTQLNILHWELVMMSIGQVLERIVHQWRKQDQQMRGNKLRICWPAGIKWSERRFVWRIEEIWVKSQNGVLIFDDQPWSAPIFLRFLCFSMSA